MTGHKKPRRHWRRRVSLARSFGGALSGRGTFQICQSEGARSALADDFSRDLAEAGQADRTGRAGGEVEHPATHKRAAVVDGHDDGTAAMGDTQLGAERPQPEMPERQFQRMGIEAEQLAGWYAATPRGSLS